MTFRRGRDRSADRRAAARGRPRRRALSGFLSVALPACGGSQGEQVVRRADRQRPPAGGARRGPFAVSIGLIICTAIVYAQTDFARTTDPGYRRDGLIQISNLNRAQIAPITDTLIREMERVEGVKGAAGASIVPASGTTRNTSVQLPGRTRPVTIGWYNAHPNFFDTMGIKLSPAQAVAAVRNDNGAIPFEPRRRPGRHAHASRRAGRLSSSTSWRRADGLRHPATRSGPSSHHLGRIECFRCDRRSRPGFALPLLREPVEAMTLQDSAFYRSFSATIGLPRSLRASSRGSEALAPEVPFVAISYASWRALYDRRRPAKTSPASPCSPS